MNIHRLRAVRQRILKVPKQFFMDWWFTTQLEWEIPNCGTAACIAGHALAIKCKSNPKRARLRYLGNESNEAEAFLDLTEKQGKSLFGLAYWPAKFHITFREAKTPQAKAKIASKRINFFIKMKGTDIA